MAQSSDRNGRIWVANLPSEAESRDVEDLFSQVGTVLFAETFPGQGSESAGLGFVCFATILEAEQAVQQFNGYSWHSRILQVMLRRPSSSHRETDGYLGVARHWQSVSDRQGGTIDSESGIGDPTAWEEGSRIGVSNQPAPVPVEPRVTSTRDTTPLLPPVTGSDRLSQSNIFPNASGVILEGNNVLSSAGRNLYNINPSVTVSIRELPQTTSPSLSTVISNTPVAQSATQVSSGFIYREGEHFSETYARLLLPKGLGWPLWLPNPLSFLPDAYRKRGISIGDVGIITKDGDFDYFFNICLPADDPINRNSVPDNFAPICHPENPEDVRVDLHAWEAGDYVVTSSVTEQTTSRSLNNTSYLDHHFSISSPNGALLSMPNGGTRKDLLNTATFLAYAKKYAPSWYKHINVTRGRGAANGSVYLITGVDKTQIWGTAVYSQPRSDIILNPLTFRKTNLELDEGSRFEYVWNRHLFATTRHGPPKESFEDTTELPHNQCTFLRGFRVALGEGLWSSIMGGGVEVSPIRDMLAESKRSNVPFSPFSYSGLSAYFGFLSGASAAHTSNDIAADPTEPVSVISEIPAPLPALHPCDLINFYLLSQEKQAEIAVTHDSIWCSILQKDDDVLPDPTDMLARIKQKYTVQYSDGCISLELKDEYQIMAASLSSLLSILVCAFCDEPFEDYPPLTLSCGHSVCSKHAEDHHCDLKNSSYIFGHDSPSAQPSLPTTPDTTILGIQTLICATVQELSSAPHQVATNVPDDTDTDDKNSRAGKRRQRRRSSTPSVTGDELVFDLRTQSSRQCLIRKDLPPESATQQGILARFQKELLSNLSCGICYTLLHQPVTTSCQHTFCFKCLHRSLDHSPACPICRKELLAFLYTREYPTNMILHTIIRKVLDAFEELKDAIGGEEDDKSCNEREGHDAPCAEEEENDAHCIGEGGNDARCIEGHDSHHIEKDKNYVEGGPDVTACDEQKGHVARCDTPVLVCQLSFPGMPTLLHFFNPNDRLMLRRCLGLNRPYFGMVMPPRPGSPSDQVDYGTMLEIRSVQQLPDGRSLVEAWGTYRFRILERGTLDGYLIARIERIDDDPGEVDVNPPNSGPEMPTPISSTTTDFAPTLTAFSPQPASSSTAPLHSVLDPVRSHLPAILSSQPSNAVLMDRCRSYLDELERNTAPWVVQRLSNTFGQMPSDVSSFSFWVTSILPIDEFEKAKLLPIRSPRLRMLLVVHWIEQLNNNWYGNFLPAKQ